jgi:hypothetical protein
MHPVGSGSGSGAELCSVVSNAITRSSLFTELVENSRFFSKSLELQNSPWIVVYGFVKIARRCLNKLSSITRRLYLK